MKTCLSNTRQLRTKLKTSFEDCITKPGSLKTGEEYRTFMKPENDWREGISVNTIVSNRIKRSIWIGNGNTGMDEAAKVQITRFYGRSDG